MYNQGFNNTLSGTSQFQRDDSDTRLNLPGSPRGGDSRDRRGSFSQKKSPQQILQAMAHKITTSNFQNVSDFFIPYDIYEDRLFESWELTIIFLDAAKEPEIIQVIQSLVRDQYTKSIKYTVLRDGLLDNLPQHVQAGMCPRVSVFKNKRRSTVVDKCFQQISDLCKHKRLAFYQIIEDECRKFFLNMNELSSLMQRLNIQQTQYDDEDVFEYFKTENFDKLINCICMNQALVEFEAEQRGGGGFGQTRGSSFGRDQSPVLNKNITVDRDDNEVFNKFQEDASNYLKVHKLNFEGLLYQFKLPQSTYITHDQFNSLLKQMGLHYTPVQFDSLCRILDTDHRGMVKTITLKQKLEDPYFGQTNQDRSGSGGRPKLQRIAAKDGSMSPRGGGLSINITPIDSHYDNNRGGHQGYNDQRNDGFQMHENYRGGDRSQTAYSGGNQYNAHGGGYDNYNQQNMPDPLLMKIIHYMKQSRYTCIKDCFPQFRQQGSTTVCTMSDFIHFLKNPALGFSQNDSTTFTKPYILASPNSRDQFINLDLLDQDIHSAEKGTPVDVAYNTRSGSAYSPRGSSNNLNPFATNPRDNSYGRNQEQITRGTDQVSFGKPILKEPLPKVIDGIMATVGKAIVSLPRVKITEALEVFDMYRNGQVTSEGFFKVMTNNYFMKTPEVQQLIGFYDPGGKNQTIRLVDFLEDVQQYISDLQVKLTISEAIQKLHTMSRNINQRDNQSSYNQHMNNTDLHQLTPLFEEIQKCLIIKKSDVFKWFSQWQTYANQGLQRNDLQQGLHSLGADSIQPRDIDTIYQQLDNKRNGSFTVEDLDEMIRKYSPKSTFELQDATLVSIINAFNGDDQFILTELNKRDPSRRGKLPLNTFVDFIILNTHFTKLDAEFLTQKYQDKFNVQEVDYNNFHNDFKQTKNSRRMTFTGHFMQPNAAHHNQYDNDPYGQKSNMMGMPGSQPFVLQGNIVGGNRNPLMPAFTRFNTKTDEKRSAQIGQQMKITTRPEQLEEIMKATYMKQQLVEDFFVGYSLNGNGSLQLNDFAHALKSLNLQWNTQSINQVYSEIDTTVNKMRKNIITCQQLDQVIAFGCKKSIEDHQDELLEIFHKQLQIKNINIGSELQLLDRQRSNMVPIDVFTNLVANKFRISNIAQLDLEFLLRKYSGIPPHQMQYLKLIDDLDQKNKSVNTQGQQMSGNVCDYIRKATLSQGILNPTDFLNKFAIQQKMGVKEFSKAIQSLGLVPEIIQDADIQHFFNEIDYRSERNIAVQQVTQFIATNSKKATRELQDDILEEISLKVRAKHGFALDHAFQTIDTRNSSNVTKIQFEQVLQQNLQVKLIDVHLLELRFIDPKDKNTINYKKFLVDYNEIASRVGRQQQDHQRVTGNLDHLSTSPLADPKVKAVLGKISHQILTQHISLYDAFSKYDRVPSSLTADIFEDILNRLKIHLESNEKWIITQAYITQQKAINYHQFLEDLKYIPNQQSGPHLTPEQQKLYDNCANSLKKNLKQKELNNILQNKDYQITGFLNSQVLAQVFKQLGLDLSPNQFNLLFSCLETNSRQDLNVKQLLELLFPNQPTYLDPTGQHTQDPNQPYVHTQGLNYIMPKNVERPLNQTLGNIGKKIINANINIEEQIKKKMTPRDYRVTDKDLYDIFAASRINLQPDEHIEMQNYLFTQKDGSGYFSAIEFLKAIGLPAQLLGKERALSQPRGPGGFEPSKTFQPQRILSPKELQDAQHIIFGLQKYLAGVRKQPKDIFEKIKQSPYDKSIPMIQFRKVLTTDFGPYGKQITDPQYQLLAMYLSETSLNDIVLARLYKAFTLTDKEPPMPQFTMVSSSTHPQTNIPLEVMDLIHFMTSNNFSVQYIFKNQRGYINKSQFDDRLQEVGFKSKNLIALAEALADPKMRDAVSLDKLTEYMGKLQGPKQKITPQIAQERFAAFDIRIRHSLSRINDYLVKSQIPLEKFFRETDQSGDGFVDKMEFVNMLNKIRIPGLQPGDYGAIFDSIDLNNDKKLSFYDFGLFLQGVQADRNIKLNQIDPVMINQMRKEILELFDKFDDNGDGFISADEIVKTMQGFGQRITLQDAKEMIKPLDQDHDGKLNRREFENLMLPKMKEDLLAVENNMQHFRDMFNEADIDRSGFLSMDELYMVVLKLGAHVTRDELIDMMEEVDVDRNGQIDIEEFMALLSMGDDLNLRKASSKNTILNIRKSRRLGPLDFFKAFKDMPGSFVPSFFSERWVKSKLNLPSCVFTPQIDPQTMLFKDLLPIMSENISSNISRDAIPKLRPMETSWGGQILLDGAEGVPIPKNSQTFDRRQIVKRSVRIGLYDSIRRDYQANVVQVNALWHADDVDVWKFNAWKDDGPNPVLLRLAEKDQNTLAHMLIIFELVIYAKITINEQKTEVQEISCGWCKLPLQMMDRDNKHILPINGGSPSAQLQINIDDIDTKRTGLKLLQSKVSKIESQLSISVRNYTSFTDETKFHLNLLPSMCLINKRLLYFVSGFRNYCAEKLLKPSTMYQFRKPDGDLIISTFPKILDNPDMCEQIINVWSEDVWASLSKSQKMSVELIKIKAEEFIRNLYPVIYADGFQFKESNTTFSAAGDDMLLRKRNELIQSALRYGNTNTKHKVDVPLVQLTTFKPFTVRELDYEVWDTSAAKQNMYMKHYENLGMGSNPNSMVNTPSAATYYNQRDNSANRYPVAQQQQPYMQGPPQSVLPQKDAKFNFNQQNQNLIPNNQKPNSMNYNQQPLQQQQNNNQYDNNESYGQNRGMQQQQQQSYSRGVNPSQVDLNKVPQVYGADNSRSKSPQPYAGVGSNDYQHQYNQSSNLQHNQGYNYEQYDNKQPSLDKSRNQDNYGRGNSYDNQQKIGGQNRSIDRDDDKYFNHQSFNDRDQWGNKQDKEDKYDNKQQYNQDNRGGNFNLTNQNQQQNIKSSSSFESLHTLQNKQGGYNNQQPSYNQYSNKEDNRYGQNDHSDSQSTLQRQSTDHNQSKSPLMNQSSNPNQRQQPQINTSGGFSSASHNQQQPNSQQQQPYNRINTTDSDKSRQQQPQISLHKVDSVDTRNQDQHSQNIAGHQQNQPGAKAGITTQGSQKDLHLQGVGSTQPGHTSATGNTQQQNAQPGGSGFSIKSMFGGGNTTQQQHPEQHATNTQQNTNNQANHPTVSTSGSQKNLDIQGVGQKQVTSQSNLGIGGSSSSNNPTSQHPATNQGTQNRPGLLSTGGTNTSQKDLNNPTNTGNRPGSINVGGLTNQPTISKNDTSFGNESNKQGSRPATQISLGGLGDSTAPKTQAPTLSVGGLSRPDTAGADKSRTGTASNLQPGGSGGPGSSGGDKKDAGVASQVKGLMNNLFK